MDSVKSKQNVTKNYELELAIFFWYGSVSFTYLLRYCSFDLCLLQKNSFSESVAVEIQHFHLIDSISMHWLWDDYDVKQTIKQLIHYFCKFPLNGRWYTLDNILKYNCMQVVRARASFPYIKIKCQFGIPYEAGLTLRGSDNLIADHWLEDFD